MGDVLLPDERNDINEGIDVDLQINVNIYNGLIRKVEL